MFLLKQIILQKQSIQMALPGKYCRIMEKQVPLLLHFLLLLLTKNPADNSPHLEYECMYTDTGKVKLNAYFSPTLNFYNTEEGLQYAISIDNEAPQIISINREDRNTGSRNME